MLGMVGFDFGGFSSLNNNIIKIMNNNIINNNIINKIITAAAVFMGKFHSDRYQNSYLLKNIGKASKG